jgi:hypothetical protein
MGRAKVRGGRKAHNKRIAKRREVLTHIEQLKKKIMEEAKERYLQEQKDKTNENTNKSSS